MLNLNFTVIRYRLSVTQGEAEVLCNGESIVRFGDEIVLGGKIDEIGGHGSINEDIAFIKAAVRDYADKISNLI
ncbi:hypothetical protein NE686_17550 [Tissierella carlieri]|uniref:Uncharacterized protein n=1 Tax=Tissierella carlieri TaxID=689904 RepID=A0ABT1SEK1_9FIRM|nr:hypothetical protein [Tissierella carlieri]MCQ4924911.1 hypothetical protein [Tissierella carlieri]